MPRLKKKNPAILLITLDAGRLRYDHFVRRYELFLLRSGNEGDGGGETRAVWQRWETSRLNAHRMWRRSLWKPCLQQNVCVCLCVRVCARDREGRETWAHSQWNATCAEHVCRSVRASQLFDTPSVGPYIKPDTYIKHFTPSSAAAAAVCRQTSVCVSVWMSVRSYWLSKKNPNASIYK